MREKRMYWWLLIGVALMLIPALTMAAEDWKAKRQTEIWSKIDVKPGDKIDKTNWEKVKDLLPPSTLEWVKSGDNYFTVGELEGDFHLFEPGWIDPHDKYGLDENLELIDKKIGQFLSHQEAIAFTDIDWKNDPNAGIKLAYNMGSACRYGTYASAFSTTWISRNKGAYRFMNGRYLARFYRGLPDEPNPGNLEQLIITAIDEPVGGVIQLTKRYLGPQVDDLYTYIPTIRRVKRMSGASRSDPFGGGDFVVDDSEGWAGKCTTMTWKAIDKKIVLVPFQVDNLGKLVKLVKQADGSWLTKDYPEDFFPRLGCDYPDWKGAPWQMVNVLYVPMEAIVVTADPVDKYYNYGQQTYYMDPVCGVPFYKVITDKAGELWKTLTLSYNRLTWGEGDDMVIHNNVFGYFIMDQRNDHACYGTGMYNRGGYSGWVKARPQDIPESMFQPNQLSSLSR